MTKKQRKGLQIISAPAIGPVVSAPPVLEASNHTIEYTCGNCGVALLHAEAGQVYNLQIQCLKCGTYNRTETLDGAGLEGDTGDLLFR